MTSSHPVLPSRPFVARRFFAPAVFAAVLISFGTACGPKDTLKAFDIELVTQSECSQVGVGAVQCEPEEELADHTIAGRWTIDERGSDAFILTTHVGKTLPGLFFANDQQVSEQCTGGGGVCYFARARTDTLVPETGCVEINQRALDSVFDEASGTLTGIFSDVTVTDEACGTPFVQEVLIQVRGTLSNESVTAREFY